MPRFLKQVVRYGYPAGYGAYRAFQDWQRYGDTKALIKGTIKGAKAAAKGYKTVTGANKQISKVYNSLKSGDNIMNKVLYGNFETQKPIIGTIDATKSRELYNKLDRKRAKGGKKQSYKVLKRKKFAKNVRKIVNAKFNPNFTFYVLNDSYNEPVIATGKYQKWWFLPALDNAQLEKIMTEAVSMTVRAEDSTVPNPNYANCKLKIKWVALNLNISMKAAVISSGWPIQLTIYHVRCKKTVDTGKFADFDAIADSDTKTGKVEITNVEDLASDYKTTNYISPWQHGTLNQYFEILKVEQHLFTAADQMIKLDCTFVPEKSWTLRKQTFAGEDPWAYSGVTHGLIFQIQDTKKQVGDDSKGAFYINYATKAKARLEELGNHGKVDTKPS